MFTLSLGCVSWRAFYAHIRNALLWLAYWWSHTHTLMYYSNSVDYKCKTLAQHRQHSKMVFLTFKPCFRLHWNPHKSQTIDLWSLCDFRWILKQDLVVNLKKKALRPSSVYSWRYHITKVFEDGCLLPFYVKKDWMDLDEI